MDSTKDLSSAASGQQSFDDLRGSQPLAIPVIEEQLQVGKQVVESGKVRISKHVVEEKVMVNVPLSHEEVDVEKVSLNQYVDAVPEVRYEGETLVIPVVKEVVEVRLVLVEEVRVTKRKVELVDSQEITLRREEVTITRENLHPPQILE